ncbi:MAG: hypothetical protein ACYC9P_01790 [Rudaea sp.]
MKSFKMKALALAVLGLGGLVMAGSAFAACPDPTAFTNKGYATPNGPWGGEFVTSSTIAAGTPGLAGTNCKMVVGFTATGGVVPGNARSYVEDDSPQNEPRYRARFYVDLTNLSAQFTNGSQQVRVFQAGASNFPSTSTKTNARAAVVDVTLVGGTPPAFRFNIADSGAPSGYKVVSIPAPTPRGVNRIEFDYNTGAGSACAPGNTKGSFCAWITDGGAASGSDSSPTPTSGIVGSNPYNLSAASFDATGTAGWSGVAFADLGVFSSTGPLQTSPAGTQTIAFDEFDSRRQTFIGQ